MPVACRLLMYHYSTRTHTRLIRLMIADRNRFDACVHEIGLSYYGQILSNLVVVNTFDMKVDLYDRRSDGRVMAVVQVGMATPSAHKQARNDHKSHWVQRIIKISLH